MQEVAPANLMLNPTSECSSVNEGHFEASDTLSIRRDTHRPGSPTAAVTLRPIVPETFQRYTRGRTIEPPLQWKAHRHPEGALYFAHEQNRIFTDAYLYDNSVLAQITCAVDQLLARPGVQSLLNTESSHIDVVLDLMKESPENDECGYYFVDHCERVIFWLDFFNMSIETSSHVSEYPAPPNMVETLIVVEMALEIEYWSVEFRMVLHELRDTIIYSVGDAMSSPTTTLSYPADFLVRMLTLTTEMSNQLTAATGESTLLNMNHGSVAFLARFMKEFARERFFHFHGEKTPRLNNDQSVYGHNPKRSYLITLISPLLFNAPLHHLHAMEIVNMDQLINYSSWYQLIAALRTEWQELVLYGTLILNTNVGFLAIPATGNSRAGQVASYASICFGLGSIILGIILVRKYRSERPDVPDLDRAVAFFQQHGWTSYGLEALSIVHSLPYALMIWGIEVRGIMLATVVTVCIAIMGFIWTEKYFSWDRKTEEWWMKMKMAPNLNAMRSIEPDVVYGVFMNPLRIEVKNTGITRYNAANFSTFVGNDLLSLGP
ncbi:hypothetical protein B0H13DRAFT_2568763 [Mycena leptocephala]|nr:hypothetical protein B0H13DRAFT_2568763 [Mycena leptocephala]